jgi:hypothetical protein
MYDDNAPVRLEAAGWEQLPDGRQQLLVVCKTILDFATMPKTLLYGPTTYRKVGWDSDRSIAFFRDGEGEDLSGPLLPGDLM